MTDQNVSAFPATRAGYEDLWGWLRGLGSVERVGVEGASSCGAGLSRRLAAHDVTVIEVLGPKRRARRGHKCDPADAEPAARAVLSGEAPACPKSADGDNPDRLLTDPPQVPRGADLRPQRTHHGLTLEAAAQALGASTPKISALERGLRHDRQLAEQTFPPSQPALDIYRNATERFAVRRAWFYCRDVSIGCAGLLTRTGQPDGIVGVEKERSGCLCLSSGRNYRSRRRSSRSARRSRLRWSSLSSNFCGSCMVMGDAGDQAAAPLLRVRRRRSLASEDRGAAFSRSPQQLTAPCGRRP